METLLTFEKKQKVSKTPFKIQILIHIFSFRNFELLLHFILSSFSRDSIVNSTEKGASSIIFYPPVS